MIELAFLLAQESMGIDPVQALINNGIMGVFWVLVLFTNRLHVHGEVERLEQLVADRDKRIAYQDRVIERFMTVSTDTTIPALQKTAQVMEAVPDKESAMLKQMNQLQESFEVMAQRLAELNLEGEAHE